MARLFVTFGCGQYGGSLAHSYLEFEVAAGSGEEDVRRFMHEEFGGKWSGLYDEKEFEGQPKKYGLTRLTLFDQDGNVLARGPNVERDL